MSERGSRSVGYSREEDKFLCKIYIKISENPITDVYQTAEQFWDRVVETFENEKIAIWHERSKKSIQCRLQTIGRATKKLHACIKKCENNCPNGSSSCDIFNQAKEMLMEDPKFKSGWKFDHVWNIVKDFEKFKHGDTRAKKISNPYDFGYISSETENPMHDSAIQKSPGLSSFSINIGDKDDNCDGSPSQQPIEVKKLKLKRKSVDQTSVIMKTLEKGNKQLLNQLKKTSAQRQRQLEIQSKNCVLKELKQENKILLRNLNLIQDPDIRAFVQAEQTRILKKRIDQQGSSASTSFG